jgi:hypothetical protein
LAALSEFSGFISRFVTWDLLAISGSIGRIRRPLYPNFYGLFQVLQFRFVTKDSSFTKLLMFVMTLAMAFFMVCC